MANKEEKYVGKKREVFLPKCNGCGTLEKEMTTSKWA
jgi:hypothetical protein